MHADVSGPRCAAGTAPGRNYHYAEVNDKKWAAKVIAHIVVPCLDHLIHIKDSTFLRITIAATARIPIAST
jgi:hypothetical protein